MSTMIEDRRIITTNSRGEHLDNVDIHLTVEHDRMEVVYYAIETHDEIDYCEKTGRQIFTVGLSTGLNLPDMDWWRSLKNLDDAIEEYRIPEQHHRQIRYYANMALERMIPTPQQDVNFAADVVSGLIDELLEVVRHDVEQCMEEFRIANPADYIEELDCGALVDEIVAKSPAGGEVEADSARNALHGILNYLKVNLTR